LGKCQSREPFALRILGAPVSRYGLLAYTDDPSLYPKAPGGRCEVRDENRQTRGDRGCVGTGCSAGRGNQPEEYSWAPSWRGRAHLLGSASLCRCLLRPKRSRIHRISPPPRSPSLRDDSFSLRGRHHFMERGIVGRKLRSQYRRCPVAVKGSIEKGEKRIVAQEPKPV